MASTATIGNGTTITFGTSAFAPSITEIAQSGGQTRAAINTSHLATSGSHTFSPGGLLDNGAFRITGFFDGSQNPPVSAAAETITIAWAGGGTSYAFSGFMTSFNIEPVKVDELMMFSSEIKIAGAITKDVTP
jgi:hypothetical protein